MANTKNDNGDTLKKVALGAATVAVAAGAAVALSDKKTRKTIAKKGKQVVNEIKDVASDITSEAGERYQATAHNVTAKRGTKKSSGRKSSKSK